MISLAGTFSVIYALSHDLMAAPSEAYTGRINQIGFDSSATLGNNFVQGDRILMGMKNPNTSNPLTWQLQNEMTYTDYGCTLTTACPPQPAVTAWHALTTESIGKTIAYSDNNNWINNTKDFKYSNTYKNYLVPINTTLASSPKDLKIVAPRNLTDEHKEIAAGPSHIPSVIFASTFSTPDLLGKNIFMLDVYTFQGTGTGASGLSMKVSSAGNKFDVVYQTASCYNLAPNQKNIVWVRNADQNSVVNNATTIAYDIRPSTMLDLSQVVFSLSASGAAGEVGVVSEPSLPTDYTALYNQAIGEPMKVRIYNNEMKASLMNLKRVDGGSLSKSGSTYAVEKKKDIKITASGNNVVANSTLSALVVDEDNKFVLYQPLGATTGIEEDFTLNISSLPTGKYNISIVNEELDTLKTESSESSLITAPLELEIVEPLSDVTYTPLPQNSMDTYEYSKNVAPNTKIGQITFQNGVKPIMLSLVSDSSAPNGHSNDFQNFELESTSVSSSPVGIKIKASGAPAIVNSSLKAGDYYFEIKLGDANGDSTTPPSQKVKLTVNKTNAILAFSSISTKDMKIGDALFPDTITSSNTDSITNSDVTFSITGGVDGILSVVTNSTNPLQYDLNVIDTHTGNGLPATFKLSATVEETDNYKKASTEIPRKIFVYKALDGLTYSPTMNGYDASDVNASGIIVGDLLAVNGIGDYTYELVKANDASYDAVKGADNSSFSVSNTATAAGVKAEVKTATVLTPKTYHIQFKVTDTKNATYYTHATIKVDSLSQPALDFKDAPGGNSITNVGKKLKFTDTKVKLLAEGGASDNANPIEYDYAPESMQGGISPADYVSINKTNGLLTPLRTGTVKVQAKRPGDGTYDDVFAYMDVTIEAAEQTITFNDTSSVISIKEGTSKEVKATGTIKSSGLTGIGSIVYSIDDPTIATVDSSTGNVTAIQSGNVILTATMNKTGETGYDSNYDTVTTTKAIKVYKGMSVTWRASSPKLKANANAIGNTAGTVTVLDNASDPSFKISTNSTADNADASYFQVIDNGTSADVQLAKVISASDWNSHSGSFKVQVDVTDSNGTQTIDVIVTLDEADNDVYFTEGGKKITSLTKKYGENANAFSLTSKTDGVNVTYSILDDPNHVLTISGKGDVTINKVGTATVQVLAGAGNGYAQKTVTMQVTIEAGVQSIAFIDTTTINQAFVKNETFSEVAELKETSQSSETSRKITYISNDPSVCDIDSISGLVTMKTIGNCDITASNKDTNWAEASVNKVINLYDGMGVSFTQTIGLQAELTSTTAGAIAGSLSVNGGIDPKTYAIVATTGAKNKDASLFQVSASGIVSFKKAIMASDLVGKYNASKKVYELYVQIETTDEMQTKVITDVILELKGAPLKASFDTEGTGKITEEYGLGKTFPLDLSSNKGGGTVTYRLKDDANMPSDVLRSVDASGLVTIEHANDKAFVGNPLKVEAVIPPSNGYDGEIIETEVEINQATQPDFAFKTPNIKLGHGASITPEFTGQLSGGTITMTSGNNALAIINGSDIKAKTTDGVVSITAMDSGSRDYKRTTAIASVTINSAPAYDFVMSVPSATYGDSGLIAKIILNDAGGANQTQTWSSSDSSIADIAQGTQLDESGEITIHKAGTVTISCTQTSVGEPSVTATAILVVDPKPITVVIVPTSKYVGETLPSFHASIPTDDLVGSDTINQPTFSCKDGSALVSASTPAGSYDISASYATGVSPNYAITIQKGVLTILQDKSQASWYHLKGESSEVPLDPNKWHKEDVTIVLDNATEGTRTYDEISVDSLLWETAIIVNSEGNNNTVISFRNKHTKAISSTQLTTVKIDKTKPTVTEITGAPAKHNALEELLHTLTNGKYFKPQLEINIKAEDSIPKGVSENSKLKAIHYEAYQLKSDGTLSDPIASGEMKATDVLKLVDEGMYMVCATAEDHAGNKSDEKCSGVRIRGMGDDSEGDGIPDLNIDTDGDGTPDINITKNPEDKIPWINIDTNGDGEPEMNIDIDGDKVPDVNTGIVSEWTCDFEVDLDLDGITDYKTSKTLKGLNNIDSDGDNYPDINIDLKLTGLPTLNINTDGTLENARINIDGNGDGQADINIDVGGDGIPDKNIMNIPAWSPTIDVKENGKVRYDTMQLEYVEKKELEDNGIIIAPGKDNSLFLPNYALKVNDITKDLNEETRNSIIEITGAKSEVRQVFDVSLMDGEKVIQPNGSILVRIPIDISIKNPRVLLRNEDGDFKEVNVTLENGYYVFETDYLGMVSIVGDKEEQTQPVPTPNPDTPKEPTVPKQPSSDSSTSVKGAYTNNGIGGANTGDSSVMMTLLCASFSSLAVIVFIGGKRSKR